MKLNAKQKDLLKELVKSKGQFKTPTIKSLVGTLQRIESPLLST